MFYKKYPEVKYMPLMGPVRFLRGGGIEQSHPASYFVHKTE